MTEVKMVVVNGVRYRPEHAPEVKQVEEPEEKPKPANKARKPRTKSVKE